MPTRLIPDPDSALPDIASVLSGLSGFARAKRRRRGGWAPVHGSPIDQEMQDGNRYSGTWGDPISGCFGMASATSWQPRRHSAPRHAYFRTHRRPSHISPSPG